MCASIVTPELAVTDIYIREFVLFPLSDVFSLVFKDGKLSKRRSTLPGIPRGDLTILRLPFFAVLFQGSLCLANFQLLSRGLKAML